MSGHSKWHNIRLRKAKVDAEKGKIFSKVTREIIMAAREGGGNPEANTRLRMAIQKAREVSMPQDNIKRAIQRGTGELEGVHYEEATFEGYGPGGVAFMIQVLTDNRKRTVGDIRNIFSRHGGNLGEAGCVAWMFQQKGVILVDGKATDEDTVMAAALEVDAEDIRTSDTTFEVITAPEILEKAKSGLEDQGVQITHAEISMIPQSTVSVAGKQAEQVIQLMEELEDQEDVQRIYANFDIPDEMLEQAA